ncbi:hypothetical protein [Marinomonas spartinae]|uniref:Uncharacterized protein n=1 Tax=Marinomonas spartinae TaxID=1792290 RepID=A0A1A8THX0_9GAMM|nr:hypothetical protein [Marinomonas spartinae]MBJ7554352.1 hypothetical protein [Marinomonas spartinae]SBS31714.1 hypothetical protein MSP8886_02214 [Marinomonas spartinae]
MPSPENYNQMLSKLGKWTFLCTLVFLIALRFFELVPKVEIDRSLAPPIKDYKELIEWLFSFGAIPLIGAVIAWLCSSIFEVHNKLSKIILLRYLWDRLFIVAPMLKRTGLSQKLNRARVKEIMNGLYYPEVKNIDQHYVHIFWRYALQFWIVFEHFLVVLITVITLWAVNRSIPDKGLLIYLALVFFIAVVHWLFVVTNKSKDQSDQISSQTIRSFFRT